MEPPYLSSSKAGLLNKKFVFTKPNSSGTWLSQRMNQKGKNPCLSVPRSRESLEVQSIILPSSGRHSIMLYTVFIECSLDIQTWLGFWETQKLKIMPRLLQILVKVKCISFLPLHPHPQSLAVLRGTIAAPGTLRENHVGYTSAHFYRGKIR